MKKIYLSATLLIVLNVCLGQKKLAIYEKGSVFTSKTNLALIDTLLRWNYSLDTLYGGLPKDTVKPIARIDFFRNKALYDKKSRYIYEKDWTPSMDFEIYNISDSSYCFWRSKLAQVLSSCVPPEVGGDIFFVGDYIFLNHDVCIGCTKYDTGVDFCRPVINYVFSKVDPARVNTLNNIVKQFPIKAGIDRR